MSATDSFQQLLAGLARERDELRVRANLAGKELRDEWDKAESLFERLQNQARQFVDHGKEVSQDTAEQSGEVWQATKLLAEEVGELFKGIGSRM